ncbi:MAG: MarR family transcriptional regulator [Bacteroidota bacterium]
MAEAFYLDHRDIEPVPVSPKFETMAPDPSSPPPFLAAVRELYSAFDTFDAAAADALGLHRTDLAALLALEHGPRRVGDVGAVLGLSSGSVTALVDRLERSGHVERRADPSDRRARLVGLTAESRREVGAIYRRSFEAIADAVSEASRKELDSAARLTRIAADACSAEAVILLGNAPKIK